jgi:hypothetical protein
MNRISIITLFLFFGTLSTGCNRIQCQGVGHGGELDQQTFTQHGKLFIAYDISSKPDFVAQMLHTTMTTLLADWNVYLIAEHCAPQIENDLT